MMEPPNEATEVFEDIRAGPSTVQHPLALNGEVVDEGCGEERADEGRLTSAGLKRTPANPPAIWAESRQELCETLTYFRVFQSGCYHVGASSHSGSLSKLAKADRDRVSRDATPFSYLLGGFGSPRDVWAHGGRVVISHGGGKAGAKVVEDDPQPAVEVVNGIGQVTPTTAASDGKGKGKGHRKAPVEIALHADQEEYHQQITALIQSHRLGTPIVLLASEDYRLLDFRLPCAFAVLGWYAITDVWAEREGQTATSLGFIRFKFRFEWLECQGRPWWLDELKSGSSADQRWDPRRTAGLSFALQARQKEKDKEGAPANDEPADKTSEVPGRPLSEKREAFSRQRFLRRPEALTPRPCGVLASSTPRSAPCPSCGVQSPRIFSVGQLCVNRACAEFWKINGAFPQPSGLKFVDDFLAPRPQSFTEATALPFDLRPPQPDPKATEAMLTSLELRGLHCLSCHRISSRQDSIGWTCAYCRRLILAPSALLAPPTVTPDTPTLEDAWINPRAGLTFSISKRRGLRWATYFFPDHFGAPRVHVIQADRLVDSDADGVFQALQANCERRADGGLNFKEIVRFKRHALTNHQMKGTLLSQQFTSNFGVQYKHTVEMGTTPLDQAPPGVTSALALIQERTSIATTIPLDFNEIYPVKYVEGQRMNFHDDGEPGLGPVVSSLSLGVTAEMSFRLKAKYLSAPGSSRASQLSHAPLAEHSQKLEALRKDRVVLKVPLPHGSICIQDGALLQVYFEHMVEPLNASGGLGAGGLRIALTARRIDVVPRPPKVKRLRGEGENPRMKKGLPPLPTMKPPPGGWDGTRLLPSNTEDTPVAVSSEPQGDDDQPRSVPSGSNSKKRKKKNQDGAATDAASRAATATTEQPSDKKHKGKQKKKDKDKDKKGRSDDDKPKASGSGWRTRQPCPHCQLSLSGLYELKRHVKKKHPEVQEPAAVAPATLASPEKVAQPPSTS